MCQVSFWHWKQDQPGLQAFFTTPQIWKLMHQLGILAVNKTNDSHTLYQVALYAVKKNKAKKGHG